MASAAKIGVSFVLGRCVPSVKQNAAKIRVTQLLLDERINMVSLTCSTTQNVKDQNKFDGILN